MRRAVFASIIALALTVPTLAFGGVNSSDDERRAPVDSSHYPNYAEVRNRLEAIASSLPGIARMESLARTWEGREVLALRLGRENKTSALVMGGHHAREPSSVEFPLGLAEYLSAQYGTNGTVRKLLDEREIWFVPMLNPDGIDYVLSANDWSWRKNRGPIDDDGDGSIDGVGVDLNRNYAHRWGEATSSTDPTAQDYIGPSPFSENETRAVRDLAYREGFRVSISYHAYGRQVFYPWNNDADADGPQTPVAKALADEVSERNGYTAMRGSALYSTYGDSDDWLFANVTAFPLTVELGTTFTPSSEDMAAQFSENVAAAVYALWASENVTRASLPEWNVLVYMAGDNTLSAQALNDLNEMEMVQDSQDISTLVLYDGAGTGDSQIYRVRNDATNLPTLSSEKIDDGGAVIDPVGREAKMDDPGTLNDFVKWAVGFSPAQKRALVIWDHGAGLLGGVCFDKGYHMEMWEIDDALRGFHIDFIGMDICYGAYAEVAYDLGGIADYMAASEGEEPEAGWDYTRILAALRTDPRAEARELSIIVVDAYEAEYSTLYYATQSALDLYILSELAVPSTTSFSNSLVSSLFYIYPEILSARNSTLSITASKEDDIDIQAFAEAISESAGLPQELRESASKLSKTLEGAIIRSFSASGTPHTRGLGIHHPGAGSFAPEYTLFGLRAIGWGDYLREFASPSQRPLITEVIIPTASNTTGPYTITARVRDDALAGVELHYRVQGSALTVLPMQASGGDSFSAHIEGAPNGTAIDFYVTAMDIDGHEAQYPDDAVRTTTYLSFIVGAQVDIYISSVEIIGQARVGQRATVRVELGNTGLEPARGAIVRLIVTGEGWARELTNSSVDIPPQGHATTFLNWTLTNSSAELLCKVEPAPGAPWDPEPGNNTAVIRVNAMGAADAPGIFTPDPLTAALIAATISAFILLAATIRFKGRRDEEFAAIERRLSILSETRDAFSGMGRDMGEASKALARAQESMDAGDTEAARNEAERAARAMDSERARVP